MFAYFKSDHSQKVSFCGGISISGWSSPVVTHLITLQPGLKIERVEHRNLSGFKKEKLHFHLTRSFSTLAPSRHSPAPPAPPASIHFSISLNGQTYLGKAHMNWVLQHFESTLWLSTHLDWVGRRWVRIGRHLNHHLLPVLLVTKKHL